MALEDEISERAKEIHTDGYPMSIGEMISLYREGDIDIHPEFQRIFRWTIDQKSRLIESILLKIPIPPIFVSQRQDGVWDVIDGVQRLSTILEFIGVYRDEDKNLVAPSTLESTEYLPDLLGYRWETGERVFSESIQRDFKRSKVDFRIIRKESDNNAKYDLFQRLNSGTQLSAQEARNCLLVMLNLRMFEKVVSLAEAHSFVNTVPLSEAKEEQAYRQELVLRFFAQATYTGQQTELRQELSEFLTEWTRTAANLFDTPKNPVDERMFIEVFSLLERSLGEDTFRPYRNGRHVGAFSIASYEFITAGVAANFELWRERPEQLREKIESIWTAHEFRENSGTGVSPRRRVPRLVNLARAYFAQT